jgi:hypothetical protein
MTPPLSAQAKLFGPPVLAPEIAVVLVDHWNDILTYGKLRDFRSNYTKKAVYKAVIIF